MNSRLHQGYKLPIYTIFWLMPNKEQARVTGNKRYKRFIHSRVDNSRRPLRFSWIPVATKAETPEMSEALVIANPPQITNKTPQFIFC